MTLALLFDKVHFPGIVIPTTVPDREAASAWQNPANFKRRSNNRDSLLKWALEYNRFCDWCIAPEFFSADRHHLASQLFKASFNRFEEEGSALFCCEIIRTPATGQDIVALTGPSYRANALLYSQEVNLPLVSDDLGATLPLATRPGRKPSTKVLAMLMATEALQVTLPPMRSVSPALVQEFRQTIFPHAIQFRRAMLKLTAHLQLAVLQDVDEEGLRNLAKGLVESLVQPELEQLKDKIESSAIYNKLYLDTGAFVLGGLGSSLNAFSAVSTIFKAAKLLKDLSEIRVNQNHMGDLHYLLRVDDGLKHKTKYQTSDWDLHNWFLDFELVAKNSPEFQLQNNPPYDMHSKRFTEPSNSKEALESVSEEAATEMTMGSNVHYPGM